MEQSVITWREGRAGRLRLNRPKALNALDLEMVQAVLAALADFGPDPDVHVVLLDAPERGFCAGGDIRTLRAGALAGDLAAISGFFTAEYAMNLAIARLEKPFVSLIDGICMGGGIGISVHGSHRVVSERAVLAMPETAIALFPDVGTSHVLPRLPGALGMYLGLTGARLAGADAVHAGMATHFVPAARLEALAAAIAADGAGVVPSFTTPLPAFSLTGQRELIDRVFGLPSVPAIFAALAAEPGDFAAATLALLRGHSPRSILWTFEILRQNAKRNLADALQAELALVCQIALDAEFLEGVRAMIVDKDRSPKWQPARVEEVDPAMISKLFGGGIG